jgi:hypothetical protein
MDSSQKSLHAREVASRKVHLNLHPRELLVQGVQQLLLRLGLAL